MKEPINIIRLQSMPVFEQLRLEEALLRVDTGNWCLLNRGSPPAIVMGISGKAEKLINSDKMVRHPLPLIRRFSGGGTVVVDEETLFMTLICNKSAVPLEKFYPEQIMRWTERLYAPVFPGNAFALRENDYVLGQRKFGGNAQYIRKTRWLHHSTLLWNYSPKLMDYLTLPEKRPAYRQDRQHCDFLCCLKEMFVDCQVFVENLIAQLERFFEPQESHFEHVLPVMEKPHRQSTRLESLAFANQK